jgi:hypothetical protein
MRVAAHVLLTILTGGAWLVVLLIRALLRMGDRRRCA